MFTGLVEEKGIIIWIEASVRTARLEVQAPLVSQGARIGDSIAVNGCCLTVIEIAGDRLTFDAVPETMARTNLNDLRTGDGVNLERPLSVGARFGGHFVQGHIDGVGTILAVEPDENALIIEIGVPPSLRRYFVEKGSVAVDGISLTVAEVRSTSFTVWIIPHTRDVTTLGERHVGSRVNLECDLLGKYIERLMSERAVPAFAA